MKKIILIIAVCLSAVGVFAQSAAQFKNDGNTALKSKDYKSALANYEKFLGAEDTVDDPALVFNSGYCAIKIKDYAKAELYFGQSIENNYKKSTAYYYKSIAQKNQKKSEEMVSTLEEGIEACPTKKSKLVKALAKHYLIEGQKAQKANEFEAAQTLYQKAATDKSKYQADALFSLGTLYYNQGAKIMQAATPVANTEPEKYKEESVKANSFYQKAIVELNKAKTIAPSREDIASTISTVKGLLK
ncbi:tetratricopeptide repeat protein [Labilibaculum sp.]|uniref:tetratricopeptide repeat protein n=1 Tax=Labilibaculum sp. TaxID=2060723 RepID=UPI00356282F4